MALIGTISGSVGVGNSLISATAISGTLIIADAAPGSFPALTSGVKLFVSGNKTTLGADTPNAIFGGDTFVSGAFGTDSYIQMKPVGTLRIPTNTTASYIYTSGSTNDLYFTQYQPGTGYTNTTRLRWLESGLQTGLQYGGVISSTSGSTTYNISSGSGLIINQNASLADDPYPTVVHVEWGNLSNQPLPSLGTTQITYIAMDSTGTPYLKSTPFLDGDYEDYIVLGRVLHTDKAGTNGAVNQPQVSYGTSQFRGDFVRAFGPIKLSGHTFYTNGTLGLRKDAGDSYAEGRNYTVNPNSPNYVLSTTDTAQNTSKIFYEYVNASGDDVILNNGNVGYTVVDFANYNNSGTLATVGSGNKFTIQRVYWFPNAVNRAFYVYYGNTIYATIADAQAGIATEVFTEGKNTRDAAIFLGYLIVKGTGVDFADSTTYKIIQAGSFRAVASSGAGSSGNPGGSDTQVQFNDAGVFGGDAGFTYNKATDSITVVGAITGSNLLISGDITGSNLRLTGDALMLGGDFSVGASTMRIWGSTAPAVGNDAFFFVSGSTFPGSNNVVHGGYTILSGGFEVKSSTGVMVSYMTPNGIVSASNDLQIGGNMTGSNMLLSGDLAVNGGDITSNTAGSFNLLTGLGASNTLNIGGSAATYNIGISTGVSTINIGSGTNTIAGANKTINIGPNTSGAGTVTVNIGSSGSNGRTTLHNDVYLTNGNLIGSPGSGGNNTLSLISSGNILLRLDTNGDVEGHKFIIQDFKNIEQFSVGENGNAEISGSLVVSGSSIQTVTTTTYNLLTSALTGTLNVGNLTTTINFGGAITTGSFTGEVNAGAKTIIASVAEKLTHTSSAGSVVNFDLSNSGIFYVTNPITANITANFINTPVTTNRVITPTIILSQSATPRIVSGVQVNSASGSILWANKVAPTGTANQQDVFGFSLIRSGSTWIVLGQMSTYGG